MVSWRRILIRNLIIYSYYTVTQLQGWPWRCPSRLRSTSCYLLLSSCDLFSLVIIHFHDTVTEPCSSPYLSGLCHLSKEASVSNIVTNFSVILNPGVISAISSFRKPHEYSYGTLFYDVLLGWLQGTLP